MYGGACVAGWGDSFLCELQMDKVTFQI